MDIRITPHPLHGDVTPPPSKSLSHRALIAATLAGSVERITNLAESQDIAATRRCLEALLTPSDGFPVLDCGESGSTLRFLIPLALVLRGGAKFVGHGRLMERPMEPYFDIFRKKNIHFEKSGGVLTVMGQLTPGVYKLPGDVSSQFVTGLLYALPLLPEESNIIITSPLQSRPYAVMTAKVLKEYGIALEYDEHDPRYFTVPGGQRFTPCDYDIEPDWSQAAFWHAGAFVNERSVLTIHSGDYFFSLQGDSEIMGWSRMLKWSGAEEKVDVSQIPDLLPPMAVMAATRHEGHFNRYGQVTRFVNIARLRTKESDRIASTSAMLRAFGVKCWDELDHLHVVSTDSIRSCTVDGANDHRIVMAAAILATVADGPVTILGAEAVNKSYPTFFDEFRRLGGIADVL